MSTLEFQPNGDFKGGFDAAHPAFFEVLLYIPIEACAVKQVAGR
jgi:hypothetical protein